MHSPIEEEITPHPTTEVKHEKLTLKQRIKVWIAGVAVLGTIISAVVVPLTFIGKAIEKNIDEKKKEEKEKEKEKATQITEIKSLNKAMNLRKNPTLDDEEIIGVGDKDTRVLVTNGYRDVNDKENHRFRNCYVCYQDKWQQVWIDEGTRNVDKEDKNLDHINEDKEDEFLDNSNMENVANSFPASTIDTIIKQKNQVTGKPVNIFGQTQGVCLQQGDNKYEFAYLMKNDKNNEDMELVIVTLSGDVLQERSKQNTQYVSVEDGNADVQYSPKNFREGQKIEGWESEPVIRDLKALQKKEKEQDRV